MVDQETDLLQRIATCDAYLNALFEFTYYQGTKHNRLTMEDIVSALHAVSTDLRTELVHVQLEKAYLSGEMRHRAQS
jgi:hypothetical protein